MCVSVRQSVGGFLVGSATQIIYLNTINIYSTSTVACPRTNTTYHTAAFAHSHHKRVNPEATNKEESILHKIRNLSIVCRDVNATG